MIFVSREIESRLSEFTHKIFLEEDRYGYWLDQLLHQKTDRWYSLIVELDKAGSEIDELFSYDENIQSKLVYQHMLSPDFKSSGVIMVLFNIAGTMWSSLVFHCPGSREVT